MNNEIKALDLAIAKLQEEKNRIIKKDAADKKSKQEKINQKISPKDKALIKELADLANWWKTEGPPLEKTIKITIKANALWTEDKTPYVDGYNILYNNREFEFDQLIRDGLFKEDLEKYQKQINDICNAADKLEKKYPGINAQIFT
jgi:hypothetical protein